MDQEKTSAVISLLVAIVVLVASYFQWWNINWDGKMSTKKWVKVLFGFAIFLLIIALLLIL